MDHSSARSYSSRPRTQKIGRHLLRRFVVEALCLLMLLYGAPLQALESALPTVEVDASDLLLEIDAILESAGQDLQAELQTGFQEAWQTADDGASNLVHQPWADAVAMMLTASSFGVTQETSSPPSPPSDERSAKDFDLASLAQGFVDKDALDAIPLLPGWNQVSLPEVPGTSDPAVSDPATVLATIGGSYSKVYAYDGCDAADPWKVYDPADPAGSDLTVIGVEQGLLIDATAAVSLPSNGILPDSTIFQLCTGWNLIGFPSAQPRHVRSALAPIMNKVVRVFGFDPFDADDPWAFFEKDAPAWASDLDTMGPGQGYWILVTEDVTFEIKNVGEAPDIAFTSPLDLDVVTAPTEIHGSVASDLLESWQLRYRGVGEPDWVDLASGSYPVNGKLGTFDPTLLLNGMYEIELTATDLQGLQVSDSIAVVVEGNMKIGHFTLSFVDLAIPLSGLDIEVVRTYDSRQRHLQGDFGYGWSLHIRQGSYRNNRPPGDGWVIHDTQGPWGLPCSPDAVQPTKSHLTTIRLSDQEVYRFELVVEDPGTIIGGCIGRADFEFIDGPIPGATLEILGNTSVLYQNNSFELRDPNTFALYEPEDVKLTTRDGRIFHLDLNDGVTHLEDLNGNTLDITPEGITHSSGRGVEFVRDAEGRIERIVDPMGNANVYAYGETGDLVTFIDRVGAETRFAYAAGHYLEDIVNAIGVRAVRTEYDDDGRTAQMIDAAGKVISFTHDLDNRRELVTNRLGFTRTMEYDGRGNVVREVDELGAVTTRTFSSKSQLLSETDPLGKTLQMAYGATGHLESTTDPLGNVTALSYDTYDVLETIQDPLGNLTRFQANSRGLLEKITDALSQPVTFTHSAQGDLLEIIDPLGHSYSWEYDAFGNLTAETDALGHRVDYGYDLNGLQTDSTNTLLLPDGATQTLQTSRVYDSVGRVLSETARDGSVIHFEYDVLGRTVATTDEMGRRTARAYDQSGRLESVQFADGTADHFSYDAEGQKVTATDRAGRITSYAYDPVGRLIATTYSDGSSVVHTYDAAGRRVATQDPRGFSTRFEYDAAGRRTKTEDALGQATTFVYDAIGQLTEQTDPRGHTTTFTYDAVGNLVTTTFPGGSETHTTFDGLGRRTSTTDELGRPTQYFYDPAGRLNKVEDPLQTETQYGYNSLGHHVSTTDALGRTTQFDVDPVGRILVRTLPDGSNESFSYNPDGTLTTHTSLAGSFFSLTYDANRRLLSRSVNGEATTFTYTPAGQRKTATSAIGTFQYSYDVLDRLIHLTDPLGQSLDFAYDASGNRTSLSATVSGQVLTTSATYDALGQIVELTDSDGGVYRHEYDAARNPTHLEYPNGVVAERQYDPRNRLMSYEATDSAGDVLQSSRYTLLPSGQRQEVLEQDGNRRQMTYDGLDRLIQFVDLEADGSQSRQVDYAYDVVGNRLREEIRNGTNAPEVRAFSYDSRNRLIAINGVSLAWDSGGRLTADGDRHLTWNAEDQLTGAQVGDWQLNTAYDADGNRFASTETDASGTRETSYLVDPSRVLSHTVTTVGNSGLTHLVQSNDTLLALLGDTPTRYVLHDGLGSVRALMAGNGTITDRYDYDPFGETRSRSGETPNTYGFAGEPFVSQAGLAFHRARWMRPALGRFVTPDPYPMEKLRPQTLNRFSYAENDPVNLTDPTGLATNLPEALTSLMTRTQLAIANYQGRVGAVFAAGGGAIWKYFRSIGLYAERIAIQTIGIAQQTIPRLSGMPPPVRDIKLSSRLIDFSLQLGRQRALLEVKYNLPWRVGEALTRLASQMEQGVASSRGQVVLWSLREPTLAQIRLAQRALSDPVAARVQFVHGVEGLYRWLQLYFSS